MQWVMPTCDVRGCKRRGAVIHAGSLTLYCRKHADKCFATYRVHSLSA